MNSVKSGLIALGCVVCFTANAQQKVSSGDLLATVFSDRKVAVQEQQIGFYQQNIKSLHFVDQVGLRARTDEFDWAQHNYSARLKVNGLGEMYRSRGLQQAVLSTEKAQKNDLFNDAVFERYSLLTRYFVLVKENTVRQKLIVVFDDKVRVMEQIAANTPESDPGELMKTDFDKEDQVLKIRENEAEMLQIKNWFSAYFPNAAQMNIDTANLISTEEIIRVASLNTYLPLSNPSIAEQESKIAEIQAEYKLEEAKQLQTLDFIQLRYDNGSNAPLFYQFDVSVGITLPYNASSRVKKSELVIEKNAAELELMLYREKVSQQVNENYAQMQQLEARRKLILEQNTAMKERYAPEKNTTLDKNGIRAMLQFEELRLKRDLKLADIDEEITARYLEILYLTGKMAASPMVNYLADDLRAVPGQ